LPWLWWQNNRNNNNNGQQQWQQWMMAGSVKAKFNQNTAWSSGQSSGCLCTGMWHAEWAGVGVSWGRGTVFFQQGHWAEIFIFNFL